MDSIEFIGCIGCLGISSWCVVLFIFISVKIQKKWLEKNMNLQWIKDHEKRIKHTMAEEIAANKKFIKKTKLISKLNINLIVFASNLFILDFFLRVPYNIMARSGLILTSVFIPLWIISTLLGTFSYDRIKKISELLKDEQI